MTTAESPFWQIADLVAETQASGFKLHVDLRRPAGGLSTSGMSPVGEYAQLLGIVLGEDDKECHQPADYFQRQRDLVVTFAATEARPTRVQVYWRRVPDNVAGIQSATLLAAAELQVSVQTDAMDIVPRVRTLSQFRIAKRTQPLLEGNEFLPAGGADENQLLSLHRPGGGCLMHCWLANDHHYVEMVHPVDYQETQCNVASDGSLRISHHLLAGRLEKGVIVRARVRGLLLRGPVDGELLAGAFANFATAAPPLTV